MFGVVRTMCNDGSAIANSGWGSCLAYEPCWAAVESGEALGSGGRSPIQRRVAQVNSQIACRLFETLQRWHLG